MPPREPRNPPYEGFSQENRTPQLAGKTPNTHSDNGIRSK